VSSFTQLRLVCKCFGEPVHQNMFNTFGGSVKYDFTYTLPTFMRLVRSYIKNQAKENTRDKRNIRHTTAAITAWLEV
jgi:hypothetical protein